MIAVIIAASLLIGVSLGVLGGGGSILTVPILVYLAGMDTKQAIATSLFVVGVTSAAGVVSHARAGRVRWRTGLLFGLAGMTGAYAGGRLAEFVPGGVLLIAFALMMIATAVAMIRGRKRQPKKVHHELPVLHVLLDGIVVGLVTGLVGAGGGFLVVPALALLGGLPMTVAVGTSLLVIAMKSFAGLAGYLASVDIDWGFATLVTATAVVGSLIGGRLAGRIPQDALRKSFGWFVAVMGVFVLSQQAEDELRHTLLTGPWTWASLAAAAGIVFSWYMLRRAGRTPEQTSDVPAESDDASRPAVLLADRSETVRGNGTTASPQDA
ncbi:sulfite exporter TauE/SafE family protein [Streptomyces sp. NPDC057257]|uniref:sulfite exporter TauE/SafE family protein n=1 Tax=Streptomyces sp. NPDC057257 TaxID=3346071 RepID=UPI003645BB96